MMKNNVLGFLFGKNNAVSLLLCLALLIGLGLGCSTANESSSKKEDTKKEDTKKEEAKSDKTDKKDESDSKKSEESDSKADASKGEEPSTPEMQSLVKEVMLDFNDAVQKEDFTDFRDKCSKPFQKDASVEKFNTSFSVFFPQKTAFQKVTDSLEDMDAEFTTGPNINKVSGVNYLEVKGKYQSFPSALNFEMEFIPEGKEWKLIKIRVVAGK